MGMPNKTKVEDILSWVNKSREPSSHSHLLQAKVHLQVAEVLREYLAREVHDFEMVKKLFILVRNLCSGGGPVAEALLDTDLLATTFAFTTSSALQHSECQPLDQDGALRLGVLRTATQFLANLATASPKCGEAVWEAFFPEGFEAICGVLSLDVVGPLCTCLLACTKSSENVSKELCSPMGAPIIVNILELVSKCESLDTARFGEDEWLLMLVGKIAYGDGLLEAIYSSIGSCTSQPTPFPLTVSRTQMEFLRFLACPDVLDWIPLGESWEGTLKAFHSIWSIAQNLMISTCCQQEESQQSVVRGALEATFTILKNLSCLDQSTLIENGEDVVTAICKKGFLTWMLGCLRSLHPIQNQQLKGCSRQLSSALTNCHAEDKLYPPRSDMCPSVSPYPGYRSDLVAIISNVVYQRAGVQQMVVDQDGVLLLLNQCQVDDGSPLVREWAVWAIRNLCEDNEEVQEIVAGLKMQGFANNDELDHLGIRIDFDTATGKLRVGRKEYGKYTFT